jgi:ATP-dependent RNA helicase DDX27
LLQQPKRDKFAGLSRKAKRRKMAMEDVNEKGNSGELNAAIRSAKKAARPAKIGISRPRAALGKSKGKKLTTRTSSGFDRELGQIPGRGEGTRAKKGDAIGGMGKKRKGK